MERTEERKETTVRLRGEFKTKIKVLGICGSPRKGNSLFLLEQALEAAKTAFPNLVEIKTYLFGQTPFAPCDACRAHIRLKGECRIKDGFQELRDQWIAADVILYSVPVYHFGIPGQVKCFIDRLGNSLGFRFGTSFRGKPFYNMPRLLKVIAGITQGIHIFAGQEHAQAFINIHALLMRCIPVPGDTWESYIGAGGWTEASPKVSALKTLVEKGKPDAKVAVRSAQSLARRAVEMAMIIREGLMANESVLGGQPAYRPVLDRMKK